MLKRMSQKESKGRGKKSKMKDSMSGAGRRNKPIHNTRPPPAAMRRKFTPEEDQIITQHVSQHGPGNWKACADKLGGRNQKTVRQRWADELDPALKKGPFSEQEYFAMWVLRTVLKMTSWALMGKRMGRSPRVLKNKMAYFKRSQQESMAEILEFALATQGYQSPSHFLDQLYRQPQLLNDLKKKLKENESSLCLSPKEEIMLKEDEMKENTTFSIGGLLDEEGLGQEIEPKKEEAKADVVVGWEDMMGKKKKNSPVSFSLDISPPYAFRLPNQNTSSRGQFCPLIKFTQEKRRLTMLTIRVQKINEIMLNHSYHQQVSEPQMTANDNSNQ